MTTLLNRNYISKETTEKFMRAPEKLAISLGNSVKEFCQETGYVMDSHNVNEITRQIFEHIDTPFNDYQRKISELPNLRNLWKDTYSSADDLTVKRAVYKYGISIFFSCYYHGIYLDQRTPYMLEHLRGNTCILLKSMEP